MNACIYHNINNQRIQIVLQNGFMFVVELKNYEIAGSAWLSNYVQANIFNILIYTASVTS